MRRHTEKRITIEYLDLDPLKAQVSVNLSYELEKRNSTFIKEAIKESLKIFDKILLLREEIESLERQSIFCDFTSVKKPILDKLSKKISERKELESMMDKLVHPYHWEGEETGRNRYILYLE